MRKYIDYIIYAAMVLFLVLLCVIKERYSEIPVYLLIATLAFLYGMVTKLLAKKCPYVYHISWGLIGVAIIVIEPTLYHYGFYSQSFRKFSKIFLRFAFLAVILFRPQMPEQKNDEKTWWY